MEIPKLENAAEAKPPKGKIRQFFSELCPGSITGAIGMSETMLDGITITSKSGNHDE